MNPQLLSAIASAATQSQGSGGQPMAPQTASTDTLGALLGSVQAAQPMRSDMPYTTQPMQAQGINPALSQQMMQMLLAMSGPRAEMPSLGALLQGRA